MKVTQCTNGKADFDNTFPLETHEINSTFCLVPGMEESPKKGSIFAKFVPKMGRLLGLKSDKPEATNTLPSPNVSCFKVARRKHLAAVDTVFFMPYAFVGALFQCNLTSTQKQEYIKNYNSGAEPPSIPCSSAVPVKPVVADDSSKGTFHWKSSPLSVSQSIPYLKTASPMDPRFGPKEASLWAQDVLVNEDYSFTDREVHRMSVASSKLAKYIHKLTTAPLVKLGNWFSFNGNNKKKQRLQEEARFAHYLSQLNRSSTLGHLQKIQSFWGASNKGPN